MCPPHDEHGSPDEHVGLDGRKQRGYEVPMRAKLDVGIVLPVEDVARPEEKPRQEVRRDVDVGL